MILSPTLGPGPYQATSQAPSLGGMLAWDLLRLPPTQCLTEPHILLGAPGLLGPPEARLGISQSFPSTNSGWEHSGPGIGTTGPAGWHQNTSLTATG